MDFKIKGKYRRKYIFDIFELVFKISFLFYGLASFNSFLTHTKLISLLLLSVTVSAGITLIYRLINFRYFIHNKMLWLSFAFLASYIVSFILNLRYANINGFKTLAFMGMQFCLLLATDERKKFEEYKNELKLILRIFSVYMMISALASIILMLCGYSNITKRNGQTILSGFVWGRLWGVFTDPNFASVLAVISIIISLYAVSLHKKAIWRAINIINIILQALYISFSDSRTGIVVAFIAVALYVYLRLSAINFKKEKFLKNFICISMAAAIGFLGVFSFKIINKVYNKTIYSIARDESEEKKEETLEKFTVGREQDIEHDISNRRFDLWESAVETVKMRPIFGVSFESITDFVEENLPDTYLVNNDHGKFNNYHNVLFNILVGQGIVGIIIFFVMVVYSGISLIKTVYNSYGTKDYLLCSLILTVLVAVLASSMFVSEIVYVISVNMMLFWYLLGIMLLKSREDVTIDKNQCNNSGI